MLTQISILYKFHDHVQVVWCLKRVIHPQNIRMVQILHNRGFTDRVADLILLNQSLFAHGFQSELLAGRLKRNPENSTERAFPKEIMHFEIFEFDIFLIASIQVLLISLLRRKLLLWVARCKSSTFHGIICSVSIHLIATKWLSICLTICLGLLEC